MKRTVGEFKAASERKGESGRAGTVVLVLVFFLLGLAGGVFLFHRPGAGQPESASGQPSIALSAHTIAILKGLNSPIQIRYYSLLSSTTVSNSLLTFASQVEQLLSEYQQAANGNLSVVRYQTLSNTNANRALADGVQPFNLGQGEGCYLGITVTGNGRKETLPRLYPEWEPALESDLSRAIERVAHPVFSPGPLATPPAFDSNAVAAVKHEITNLDSVSVEQGIQILRAAALKEFQTAASESETQLKQAQEALARAQSSGSAAEQQAAMQHYREIQAAQAERLKQLGARLQAQIAALQRLKQQ